MRIALALVLLVGTRLALWAQPAPAQPPAAADMRPPATSPGATIDARAVLQAMEEAFSAVADRVTPAVVNISTISRRPAPGSADDPQRFREFFGDEFYERYFRRRPARSRGPGAPASSWIQPDTS